MKQHNVDGLDQLAITGAGLAPDNVRFEPGASAPESDRADALHARGYASEGAARLVALAERAAAEGDARGAARALALAASSDPSDMALRARAETAAREALTEMGARSAWVNAFVIAATASERARDWVSAACNWTEATKLRPDDPTLRRRCAIALVHQAQSALRAGARLSTAAECARRATRLDPRNVSAHTTLVEIYLREGMRASASAALDAASCLAPDAREIQQLRQRVGRASAG